jgi:hypothetical protein
MPAKKKDELDLTKLDEPFSDDELEWRIQNIRKDWTGALIVPYIQNRAIQNRLDSVCGKHRWSNHFEEGPSGGVVCGLSIYVDENICITKYDGAENTQIEAVKGGLTDSMKRAAVQWGIGRYLYSFPKVWVDELGGYLGSDTHVHYDKATQKKFYWKPPKQSDLLNGNGNQKQGNQHSDITDEQQHMFDLAIKGGWIREHLLALVGSYGYESSADVKPEHYDVICDVLEGGQAQYLKAKKEEAEAEAKENTTKDAGSPEMKDDLAPDYETHQKQFPQEVPNVGDFRPEFQS